MTAETTSEVTVDPRAVYDECGRQLAQLAAQGQRRGDEEFELVLDRRIAASELLPDSDRESHAARTDRNEPITYRHAAVSASLVAAARFGNALEQAARQDTPGQQQ